VSNVRAGCCRQSVSIESHRLLTATCIERMVHLSGAFIMRIVSVVGLCVVVAGCSSTTSDRIAARESPDERMTRIVLAGRQECEARFPTTLRHNHLAQAQCVVEFKERVVMPQDQFPDLIGKLNATSLVVAEKQDKGTISDAEASQQLADAKSAAISELLRRRAEGAQTQAQTASAQSAQSQATTAALSAPNPFVVPEYNPCAVLTGGRCR